MECALDENFFVKKMTKALKDKSFLAKMCTSDSYRFYGRRKVLKTLLLTTEHLQQVHYLDKFLLIAITLVSMTMT